MKSKWAQLDGCIELGGKSFTITLEPRPHYCDRGNFIAKIFETGNKVATLDDADGWPRYYFDLERAKAECEAWLQKRSRS